MSNGFYQAVSALVSRMSALDVVAHNLANANTTGFRAQRQLFSSVLASAQGDAQYGILSGTRTDLTQGSLEKTGNELDLAIDGTGFFALKTAHGTRYTRDGSFRLDRQGNLVNAAGDAVLGEGGVPVQLPSGKIAIGPDGTLAVDEAVAGKLQIVAPNDATALSPAGDNQFSADPKSMHDGEGFSVHQGALEGSNISPVEGAVELVKLQRQADMMQRVIQIFNSDFNRTAIEQVARPL